MNDSQFDSALRALHRAQAEPGTLESKVAFALARAGKGRIFRRRVGISFAATAAAAIVLVAYPTVLAQASLMGMSRALDQADHVVLTTYTVDHDGHKSKYATAVFANGDEWFREASGRQDYLAIKDNTYSLDPTIGAYIVRPRERRLELKLSAMLGPGGEFSVNRPTVIDQVKMNGKTFIRATIRNPGLNERYVIFADPKSDLPQSAEVQSMERGSWGTRQFMSFEYGANVAVPAPDLAHYRVVTAEDARQEFIAAMERKTLAEAKFSKGRIVIRAVEVALDGTVFVAYQVGDKSSNSWRGYAVNVADNLGTRYTRAGQGAYMVGPFKSKDGRVEMEVFCPVNSIPSDSLRKLTISTQTDPDGRFTYMIKGGVRFPDGHTEFHWQPNYRNKDYGAATVVPLLSIDVKATCVTHPSWAETLDFTSFGNPIAAEMRKADARGDAALEDHRWEDAKACFNAELELMREHERKGYGPWSEDQVLTKLDQARSKVYKPQ